MKILTTIQEIKAYAADCKAQGKTIGGWTVNTRKDARRLLSMNLDGIVTDRYDLLTEMQERMANRPDYQRVMDTLRY